MSEPATHPPGVWQRLRKNRGAVVAMVVLAAIILFAVLAPVFFHTDAHSTSTGQFVAPSAQHFFGTDLLGRDLFSRVIEGARISLLVGVCGALVSFLIGTSYGLIAGYAGGRLDSVMMRVVEVLYAIPRLIIIIIASFIFDPFMKAWLAPIHWKLGWGVLTSEIAPGDLVGYSKILILILSLGLIEWLTMARIVRGQVLSLKNQQFVLAARSLGQSHFRIITRHLLPNLIGIVVVYLTLTIPAVILDESFLSFLGLGIQAPQSSWGSLLADGAQVINPIRSYWWLLFFPAAIMSLTLLALNFLGDGLRDALDPRQSKV